MDDNTKLYLKIQELVKNEARQVATEVFNKLGTQYGVGKVPIAVHDGTDTTQINQKNIIPGNKYGTLLQIFDDGGPLTTTITLGGIANPTRIFFQGFAANNADGSPATKRAIINGEINFGTCFLFSDLTPPIAVSTVGSGIPFIQSSNSMYVDSTDLTKNRVFTNPLSFIYALDDTGTVIAQCTAITYNNQLGLLTITCTVGLNWKIQGAFTIT